MSAGQPCPAPGRATFQVVSAAWPPKSGPAPPQRQAQTGPAFVTPARAAADRHRIGFRRGDMGPMGRMGRTRHGAHRTWDATPERVTGPELLDRDPAATMLESRPCPGGGTGRRTGLKILWGGTPVRVRFPSRAFAQNPRPTRLSGRHPYFAFRTSQIALSPGCACTVPASIQLQLTGTKMGDFALKLVFNIERQ